MRKPVRSTAPTPRTATRFPLRAWPTFWGGEPFQEFDWIRTLPNGDWYGYAVMEQRRIGPDLITLDTPIQSFRALQVGEDRPRYRLVLQHRHR